jgi:Uncharacterised protein family (UPF0153).
MRISLILLNDKNLLAISNLHKTIDRLVNDLSQENASRLHCKKGCHDCCIDDLSVFEIEAFNIRHFNEALLKTGIPHQKGLCAFLDKNGACRIYNQRPYVCRTQGLPLHWIEEQKNGTMVAMRDICPINDPGIPVEDLPEDLCWKIGPFEEQLARLQYDIDKCDTLRVKLRDLFSAPRDLL